MMLCPACLAFQVQTDAVSVVTGTQYCAQHAVEALGMANGGMRGRMGGGPMANLPAMAQFSPPVQTPAPAPAP